MDAIATVALFVNSLLLIHLASSTTAAAPPLLPPTSCSTAIILFSPCLPYISSPPNDLDSRVTPYCCRAYSLVLVSGSGICLCYLLREPDMLGFPLNNTRLISLSSDCSLLNVSFVNRGSLESLCSGKLLCPALVYR
ncbi:hypothetical protein CRG98_040101 [Punica granatum]|uniref:Bifunctional inhibitor/plant lipid transfer protein/seed storage helical domain-containing protein n=1 Tax=Punica granatum TaxID=22663 RepID=A0A2I0I690_PUNGR|nr:hypothetical protein CRG98_040101 [Punica granatum]